MYSRINENDTTHFASCSYGDRCDRLPGIAAHQRYAPELLIIVTDDQRYDTMEYMPNTQRLIFDQGATFSRGYVTTPFCCPSRASILTGMYAHNHGVYVNEIPLEIGTVAEALYRNGYFTGLVGKYLNSWNGDMRPEFDYWVSFWGGTMKHYYDPDLNVNGTWSKHAGYSTYLFRDYGLEFLDEAARQSRPFFLLYTPNAPHAPFTPAKEDTALYTDLPPYARSVSTRRTFRISRNPYRTWRSCPLKTLPQLITPADGRF